MTHTLAPVAAHPRFDVDEIVAGLEPWIRTESPTFHTAGVNAMMDLASSAMDEVGAEIERRPGRDGFGDVVLARMPWNAGEPGILVLAHLDTVQPVGALAERVPFRYAAGVLQGPGVYDMKGGAYIAWFALREIVRSVGRTLLPVSFLFTPDEEVGSPTSRELIEEEARRSRYVLVPEPAQDDGNLITGRWAFQRFHVRALGKPAHAGATLERGRSAIREIAGQIDRIEALSRPADRVTVSVGVVRGGTFVNVVPSECEAEVLAVTPTASDYEAIRQAMSSLEPIHEGIELEVVPGPVRPLWEPTPGGLALYEHVRALAAEIGFSPGHGSVGGGSDGNFTGALGVPTLDGLGLCGGDFHTDAEHVLVSSIEPRTRLLARLFETLA
jgi:glutamate carboxypeptidase